MTKRIIERDEKGIRVESGFDDGLAERTIKLPTSLEFAQRRLEQARLDHEDKIAQAVDARRRMLEASGDAESAPDIAACERLLRMLAASP